MEMAYVGGRYSVGGSLQRVVSEKETGSRRNCHATAGRNLKHRLNQASRMKRRRGLPRHYYSA
jgi:hypothetical protein